MRVLIAGCGTGQQVMYAQRYRGADIIAIDLSAASIAYAQRKIHEAGIDNVEFIQMDLLDVALLNRRFDVIECAGVLHHMEDPAAGLGSLMEVLADGGYLKLALYSELARRDVVKAREHIQQLGLQPNPEGIRLLRQQILSQNLRGLDSFMKWRDFFSMSACRDLCFHVQEHRYSLAQMRALLETYHLRFLGFLLPKSLHSLYANEYPQDPTHTDLNHWSDFEDSHPNTFGGMYQFWVVRDNP